MKNITIFLVIMAATLAGCHRRGETIEDDKYCVARPGCIVTNSQVKVSLKNLSENDVLVCVGNRRLTKRDLLNEQKEIFETITKLSKSSRAATRKIREVAPNIPWQIASIFVNRVPFILEAKELGVKPTDADLKAAKGMREHVCAILGLSLEEYANRYHGGIERLNEKISDEAANKALFRNLFTNSLIVADAEIQKMRNELTEANSVVAKSNVVLRKEFETLRGRIVSGELSVEDLEAKQELMGSEMDVDEFQGVVADYFDDDARLLVEFQSLTNGTWSTIHETEEEYAIFLKTDFRPRNFQSPDFYTGVKVSVKKDLGFLVPDVARARRDLRYIKNREIVLPKAQELALKFGVVFPHGTYWADEPLRASSEKAVKSNQLRRR